MAYFLDVNAIACLPLPTGTTVCTQTFLYFLWGSGPTWLFVESLSLGGNLYPDLHDVASPLTLL